MAVWIVKLLKLVSMIACLIVLASFAIFVVHQTGSASKHQQEVVAGRSSAPASTQQSGLHKAIDEASDQLTSPFAGIVSSSSSEWGSRLVKLILSLLVYGLGLGYLMRVISVRA